MKLTAQESGEAVPPSPVIPDALRRCCRRGDSGTALGGGEIAAEGRGRPGQGRERLRGEARAGESGAAGEIVGRGNVRGLQQLHRRICR